VEKTKLFSCTPSCTFSDIVTYYDRVVFISTAGSFVDLLEGFQERNARFAIANFSQFLPYNVWFGPYVRPLTFHRLLMLICVSYFFVGNFSRLLQTRDSGSNWAIVRTHTYTKSDMVRLTFWAVLHVRVL
jgi:hypothetical protein